MSWVEERDRLIAETIAFVKEVTGEAPEPATARHGSLADSAVDSQVFSVAPAAAPHELAASKLEPLKLVDMREDITARVASFKARQQSMQDERETYFRKTLDDARAKTRR
jgi:hypothetical protein